MESEIRVEDLEIPVDRSEDATMEVSIEESVEQKEKRIFREMIKYQLDYATRLQNGEIEFFAGEEEKQKWLEMNDNQYILAFTKLEIRIFEKYRKRVGLNINLLSWHKESDKQFKDVREKIVLQIESDVSFKDFDFEALSAKIDDIIDQCINELPEQQQQQAIETKSPISEKGEVGPISYYVQPNYIDELTEKGILKTDLCLDVHFQTLALKEDGQTTNLFSLLDAMEEIRAIAKKNPDIKAITGASWLMDWVIKSDEKRAKAAEKRGRDGRKFGFNPVEVDKFTRANAFWGQFIKADGSIYQNKMEDFLETGKPKYEYKVGYIKREDF